MANNKKHDAISRKVVLGQFEYFHKHMEVSPIHRKAVKECCEAHKNILERAASIENGLWIEKTSYDPDTGLVITEFECSLCDGYSYFETPFCPNCGHPMFNGREMK